MRDEKEILKMFKSKISSKKLIEKLGPLKTSEYLNFLLPYLYIENKEDKYKLTKLGQRRLSSLEAKEKNEKTKEFFKHPLFILFASVILTALITIPSTTYFTHKNAIAELEYQKTLTVSLLEPQQISIRPQQPFYYNGIVLYNPTSNKISIKAVFVSPDNKWYKAEINSSQKTKSAKAETNMTENIPDLKQDYKPYMELNPGETQLIKGVFTLISPKEKGSYTLNFYAETMDGKIYFINKPLIINVI